MTKIMLQSLIRVTDKKALNAFARDLGAERTDSLARHVYKAVVNPDRPPVDTGYEFIAGTDVDPKGDDCFLITITAEIHDPAQLAAEAVDRYRTCWQDNDWEPETLCEALYEVVMASNSSPSPNEVGFEFIDHQFLNDTPAQTTANSAPSP